MRLTARSAFAVTVIGLAFGTTPAALSAQASGPPSSAAPVAPDSERIALTRELLELMRVGPAMVQGLEIGLASQKAANPTIPEVFWTEFATRARRDVPKFVESVLPIYASRFSVQELRQFIAFYRTPAGRRLAEEGGAISAELMRAGQRWGLELGADTMKELAAKGVMVP